MPHLPGAGEAAGRLQALAAFRRELYGCFGRWADTLFELVDALAGTARPIRSVAELMFEPVLRRGWGSLYQALQHGGLDVTAARRLLARYLHPAPGGPLLFAIDVSKFPRPDTRYVPDVGMQYAAERDGSGAAPAVPGWAMLWLCQVGLDQTAPTGSPTGSPIGGPVGSWVAPLDVRRVPTAGNANELAAAQINDLVALLRADRPDRPDRSGVPLFLLDSGFCPIYLTQQLPAGAQILVRLRGDRVFFGPPPPRIPGKVGHPGKHGARCKLDEPDTWGPPDAEHRTSHHDGSTIWTRAWHRRHPQAQSRRKWAGTGIVEGTLIRREHRHRSGHTQVWWLWWAAGGSAPTDVFDLPMLADAYPHRYTIEHGFRYKKQHLSWTGHTPLDPDQAERWSWLVAFAYSQLRLARPLTVDHRLPWEKPCPPEHLSPHRVRRVFRRTTANLPTPANPPKPSRPGTGRPKGSTNKHPRTRQPVIKKGRPANTGHRKGHNPNAKITKNP